MQILAPPPPSSWPKDKDHLIFSSLQPCRLISLEPVGSLGFIQHARRIRHNRSLSEDERMQEALKITETEDVNLEEDEEETAALLASDPTDTKNQDHYAILGLSNLRWKATEDDIRRAYRRKVLKHHPDKKEDTSDDAFFKCVQFAWETMSDPVKRKQWDSVDPQFDEDLPPVKVKNPDQFYKSYGKCFDNNSRFSSIQPVPSLGGSDASREEVESFYDFWYNFESWRTFEAYDEEDPEKAESREEKRYIERLNRAARTKRKKEDNARIISLVEQAMKLDPRLQKFKQEDKMAKEEKKKEAEMALQRAAEEKAQQLEQERLEQEKKDAEEKARLQEEKKDRDARKKVARKDRKIIRDLVKQAQYYLQDATQETLLYEAVYLEEMLESLADDTTAQLKQQLQNPSDPSQLRTLLEEYYDKHRAERNMTPRPKTATPTPDKPVEKETPWTPKEVTILIKAFKLFPGGTVGRWNKISDYVNEHGGEEGEDEKTKKRRHRRPADVIAKSKELEAGSNVLGHDDKEKLQATVLPKKPEVVIKEIPSHRDEPLVEQVKNLTVSENAPEKVKQTVEKVTEKVAEKMEDSIWSTAQQSALETALRQYPASAFKENPNERWEKIAEMVPGKSKKDIKTRVKELVELAKSKKGGK